MVNLKNKTYSLVILSLLISSEVLAQALSGAAVLSEVTDNPKLKCWHDGAESITMIDSALNRTHSSLNNAQKSAHTLQKYTGSVETIDRLEKAADHNTVQHVKSTQITMGETIDAQIKDATRNIEVSLNNAIYTKTMLDMATIEATKEEEIERKMYSSCIATLTRYSYKAYEQLRFFLPRQISDGTTHSLQWMQQSDQIAESINKIVFIKGGSYSDATNAYTSAITSLNQIAANYKSSYTTQNMSDRMQATWACGQSLTATAAMLTWTRSPNDIDAKSPTTRYNLILEMINRSLTDITNGCRNQIQGFLPAVVNELKVCQAWAGDFKHYLRLCSREDVPPTIIDSSLANLTGSSAIASFSATENRLNTAKFEVAKVLADFADEYEQTPFYRVIYARVLAKLAEARVSNLQNSIETMKKQSDNISSHKPIFNIIKKLTLNIINTISSVYAAGFTVGEIKSYKLGCLTVSKYGTCESLRTRVYQNRYIYRDDRYTRLKIVMADIGDELRKSGETTPKAKALLRELRANSEYIKQKADLAVAAMGKAIYNDPLGLDTFSNLILQKLEIDSDIALQNSGVNSRSSRTRSRKSRSLINRAMSKTNFYGPSTPNGPPRDNYVLITDEDISTYKKRKPRRKEIYVRKKYHLVDQADINSDKYQSIFRIISKHYIQRINTLFKR